MSGWSQMLAEVHTSLDGVEEKALAAACARIASAGNIMIAGCGRERLQLAGFAMRLHHLGLRASVQGDMNAPPLGPGDVLVASAGPGELGTITSLMRTAREAGAAIVFLTAQADSPHARAADAAIVLPARTMADGDASSEARLPLGSVYEGALFFLFEEMIARIASRNGVTPEQMRANHTNME